MLFHPHEYRYIHKPAPWQDMTCRRLSSLCIWLKIKLRCFEFMGHIGADGVNHTYVWVVIRLFVQSGTSTHPGGGYWMRSGRPFSRPVLNGPHLYARYTYALSSNWVITMLSAVHNVASCLSLHHEERWLTRCRWNHRPSIRTKYVLMGYTATKYLWSMISVFDCVFAPVFVPKFLYRGRGCGCCGCVFYSLFYFYFFSLSMCRPIQMEMARAMDWN